MNNMNGKEQRANDIYAKLEHTFTCQWMKKKKKSRGKNIIEAKKKLRKKWRKSNAFIKL